MDPNHAIRRIVTGHDASGKAVVVMDGAAPNSKVRPGTGFISTLLWVTDESPARADTGTDRADRTMGVQPPANGSVLRVVEFPPVTPEAEAMDQKAIVASMGADHHAHDGKAARHAFMHRTKSVDYCFVLTGEITMLLDDSEVQMKAGDFLVQQGTNHAWVNRSDKPCRVGFVLIDAHDPLVK